MAPKRRDAQDENYAQAHRRDRLSTDEDGLNAEVPDLQTQIDEEIEQTFPASDPPVVTRRSIKDKPG